MKILKLHIVKLRGIVDLELDFDGKNAVIVGPNGVGKSAVVDAIDFLLKGDITRLKGEGTGDVSVLRHGPHIGSTPVDAKVSAVIQSINGKIFEVTRTVADKGTVQIEEAYTAEFKDMVDYARSGAHFLSRRELLRYILTTPATRSEQIQALLDIKDLKETRNAFIKLKSKVNKHFKDCQKVNKINIASLLSILNVSKETEETEMLTSINTLRQTLGGEKLADLSDGHFISNLTYSDTKDNEAITTLIRNSTFRAAGQGRVI